MKRILSEKNLVVVLFILVFITFSMAHEDTKKMEKANAGFQSAASATIAFSELPDPVQSSAGKK